MQLTFSPSLKEITTLKVAPAPSPILGQAANTQSILFKATFASRNAYSQAQASRVKVEVWTNLPIEGRPHGEWGPVQFSEQGRGQRKDATGSEYSLSPAGEEGSDSEHAHDEDNTLYLDLRTSLQDHIGSQFSYTYRLVWPSGRVEWLGMPGDNGVLVVEQAFPGIDLSERWGVCANGKLHFDPPSGCSTLGRLEQPKEWSCWAWRASSLPVHFTDAEPCEGRAMVLLPHRSARGGDVPRPLILATGGTSFIRLTSDGTILLDTSDSTGYATLGALEHSRDLLEEAAALCNGVVVAFDSSSAVISCRQQDVALPFHVVILPIASATSGPLFIPLQMLQPLVSQVSESDGLVLFSPKSRKVDVLRTQLSDDSGLLRLDSSGSEMLAVPIHFVRNSDRAWQVSMLAPCKSFSLRTETRSSQDTLPTPPPSPPARDPPTLSAAPEIESRPSEAPVPAVPSTPRGNGHSTRRAGERRRRSSFVLARNLPARVLRVYLHAVLNVVFWFWSVFFKSLVTRVVGEGIPRIISRLLSFALSKTASSGSLGAGGASGGEESWVRGTASPTVDSADVPVTTPRGVLSAPDDRCGDPAPQSQRPPSSLKGREVAPQVASRVVLSAALIRPEQSLPVAILQGSGLVQGLRVTLDGQALSTSTSITPLGDDMHLLEVDGLTGGGQLEVSFDF